MFSLHMPDRNEEPVRKRDKSIGSSGVALGFAAGLTVVIAIDTLVLNHTLLRETSRLHWYMPQLARSEVALSWR